MSASCRPGVNGAWMFIVLLSGLCSGLHQYQLVDEPKTWSEAQQYCREKFSDLATVDNMEDVDQLLAAAGSGYTGKVWIGLYDNSSSWRWSMADDGFHKTNNQLFLPWAPGEPNHPRHEGMLCGAVQGGRLHDVTCLNRSAFVCYDDSDEYRSPSIVPKSWSRAQNYCQKTYTDLASIRNEEELTQIQQAVPQDQYVFTGLYRRTWNSWSDGSEHEFKNFLPGRPLAKTGDCAASLIGADEAGKWVEDHCEQKLPFMCHYEKKQQFRIKLRILKSTVELNDPAVTEAILRLLEKKLKEKGIIAGFRLRWIKKPDNSVFQEEKDEL